MTTTSNRLEDPRLKGLTEAQARQAAAEGWAPDVQAAVAAANASIASRSPAAPARQPVEAAVAAEVSPLSQLRERFPQYANVSDADLADALYDKFYSQMPRADYDARLGLTSPAGGKPIVVEGTDGQVFQFPAGTDQGTMQAALQRHYANSQQQQGRQPATFTAEQQAAIERAQSGPEPVASELELARARAAARQRQLREQMESSGPQDRTQAVPNDGRSVADAMNGRGMGYEQYRQATGSSQRFDPIQAAMASEGAPAPRRGLLDRIGDNVIGYDDGVESFGEKLATATNIGVEGLTLGLVGDEANAAADSLVGRGGYDERVSRYRGKEEAFRDSNPLLAFGAEVAPAFIPGVGLARGVGAVGNVAGRVATGLLGGAVAGGTYGFMEGEGTDDRLEKGIVGGIVGGGLGLAMEPVARGARALYGMAGPGAAAAARGARSAMGLDEAGARMVAQAVERDMPYAAENLRRAGPDATNAQIGNNTKGLLDAVVNRPGAAGSAALARVEEIASTASQNFTRALDDALGAPVGVARQQRQIMRESAAGRLEAYEAAYARAIDYSTPETKVLEGLLDRVPEEAIRKAEKLMRTEGAQSRQIKATIGDNGDVAYDRLPDVQQIDYITRALRDMGGFGVGEGATQGRAYATLARDLRRQLDELVPEYRTARAAGKDAIANREAAEFGEGLLSQTTKMDVAEDMLAEMTQGERRFVRQGMRDHVDEVMANTKAALTDQNMDAREALRPLKEMLGRAGQRKLRALMGEEEARRLIAAGEEAFSALNLRASIATNSKTAPRLIAEGILDDAVPPTIGEAISEGRGLLGAMAVAARPLLNDAAVQRAVRKDGVMERVGAALLSPVQTGAQGGLLAQQLAPALRAADAAQEVTQRRVRGLLSTIGATQGTNITR